MKELIKKQLTGAGIFFLVLITLGLFFGYVFTEKRPTWPLGLGVTLLAAITVGYSWIKGFGAKIQRIILEITNFKWGAISQGGGETTEAEGRYIKEIIIPYGNDDVLRTIIQLHIQSRINKGMEETKKLALEVRNMMRFKVHQEPLEFWKAFISMEAREAFKPIIKQKVPKYDPSLAPGENMARIEDFLKSVFLPYLTITEDWFSLHDEYGVKAMFASVPQEHLRKIVNTLERNCQSFFSSTQKQYLYQDVQIQLAKMFEHVRLQIMQPEAIA